MKTNVILKNGVAIMCDVVKVYSNLVIVYKHNLMNSQKIEILNYCLNEGLECNEENNCLHENGMRICIPKERVEQFSIATL